MRRLITQWWRPLTCLWISGTMLVHGIILPLLTRTTDTMALATLITATAAAFAVREWGKIKGTAE